MSKLENYGLGLNDLFNIWSPIMKPHIEDTKFGSITIDGYTYNHDVVIALSGEIKQRNNNLSADVYGTSHKISLQEAKSVYERGAENIIIGTGQNGRLAISTEAMEFLKKKNIIVKMLMTPEAISFWNETSGLIIGLFHVTC